MKLIIIISVIFLLIIGVGVFLYFFYEKPTSEDEIVYTDINIFAYEGSKNIETGYEISVGVSGSNYKNGTTLLGGAVLEKVPINSTIYITNINIKNQTYYNQTKRINTTETGPFRVEFDLERSGIINIHHQGSIGSNCDMDLILESKESYRDITLCFEWSYHIVRVETNSSFNREKNSRDYDRCFYTGLDLENSELMIPVNCKILGVINDEDYIKVGVFDKRGSEKTYFIKK